jgi:signal transduction histidine kinase
MLGSIRFRITAIAALVVALVFAAVAVAIVALVHRELLSNLDNSLEQRADTYSTAFVEADSNDLLNANLLNSSDEDRAAQLADTNGVIVASTSNLTGAALADHIASSAARQTIRNTTIGALEDDAFRVLARPVELPTGPAVLYVAENIDDLNDTVRGLEMALALTLPAVVALLAGLVWWLVGRTLRPVELMRAEVADISGTDLRRRLPVPAQSDEIARLASTMNQMLDRIDGAGRRQRQFVADASHELRTPLTRIRTEVEVDLNRPDLADPAATNSKVLEESVALQELLDDLLFLARSDEHENSLVRVPTDLDDIVLREVGDLRCETALTFDTSGVSAAHLDADTGQLRRVVRNLIDNAARHAQRVVTITCDERDGTIRLAVADDGDGVPVDSRERIFERFGRVDDARTSTSGGTGLGLAIVHDIVKRHGGEIRYDEEWTDGARFIVELPCESDFGDADRTDV